MKSCLPLFCLLTLSSPLAWAAPEVALLQFERNGVPLDPIAIELFENDAPQHVANFKKLIQKGFYKGLQIHRVVPETLVQFGDPLSRSKDRTDLGTGGPGYTIAPEIHRRHGVGAVGMGRLADAVNPGRLSNGSQFYVTLKPLPTLDGKHTVFGQVLEGNAVLETLGNVATDTSDAPVQAITLRRSTVVPLSDLATQVRVLQEKAQRAKQPWWKRWIRPWSGA
jgi:peptidyl-prolyl cis-trans isomerase B (cyclophilin B)